MGSYASCSLIPCELSWIMKVVKLKYRRYFTYNESLLTLSFSITSSFWRDAKHKASFSIHALIYSAQISRSLQPTNLNDGNSTRIFFQQLICPKQCDTIWCMRCYVLVLVLSWETIVTLVFATIPLISRVFPLLHFCNDDSKCFSFGAIHDIAFSQSALLSASGKPQPRGLAQRRIIINSLNPWWNDFFMNSLHLMMSNLERGWKLISCKLQLVVSVENFEENKWKVFKNLRQSNCDAEGFYLMRILMSKIQLYVFSTILVHSTIYIYITSPNCWGRNLLKGNQIAHLFNQLKLEDFNYFLKCVQLHRPGNYKHAVLN